jgi:hypothetical protein
MGLQPLCLGLSFSKAARPWAACKKPAFESLKNGF